jgi:hypothetical protein
MHHFSANSDFSKSSEQFPIFGPSGAVSSVSFEYLSKEHMRNLMSGLDICLANSIPTEIIVEDDRNESPVDCKIPTLSTVYFVHKTVRSISLILNANETSNSITLSLQLSLGLCKLLCLPISYTTVIRNLIDCEPDHITEYLSVLRIEKNSASLREKLRGLPGEPLCDIDKLLLDLKPFKSYRPGEIVAVVYDPQTPLTASAMSNEVEGTLSHSSVEISNIGDDLGEIDVNNLRYGKIFDVGDRSEHGLRKIGVRVGQEQYYFLCTKVYSFKSSREERKSVSRGSSPRKEASASSSVPSVFARGGGGKQGGGAGNLKLSP